MEERREFLPPEPAGPEPELGERPRREAPPAGSPGPAQPGWQPPAQASWHPPGQPAQPGAPPAGAWQPPPAPGWGYPPQTAQPDNAPAVTGFVLSLVSAGLLLMSGGISSLISVGCSIAAIVVSRNGKRKVERGETQKNRGLAQAGFIIGIVGLVLAVLATIVWTLIVIGLATSEEFRDDFENELDGTDSIRAVVTVAAAGARLLIG